MSKAGADVYGAIVEGGGGEGSGGTKGEVASL